MTACAALLLSGLVAVTTTPAAAAPALAAHWALDEGSGTTAADSSGNAHTGTLGSGAAWATGEVGPGAVSLDKSASGAVDVPSPVVNTSASFTVSAWVKLNAMSGAQTVVSIDGTNVSGFYLQLSGTTGKFAFTRRGSDSTSGAETRADGTASPSSGTWYHLVGVDDVAAGTLRLYVDGKAQGTAAYTTAWKAAGHTEIGRGLWSGAATDFVNGSVDDVRFYSGAMTAAEVAAVNEPAHWAFDEGSGTTAADSTGNGHTATLGSAAAWTTGKTGSSALALNGTSAATATASGAAVDTSRGFSAVAWVKLNSTSGFQTAVSIDGTNVSGFYLQLSGATGKFAFTRRGSDSTSSAETRADATASPSTGTWYQLIGVNDVAAGKLQLYVNGLLQSSVPYTGNWKATGTTAIGRGRWSGSAVNFLNGAVDDVQLYDHALTGSEVAGVSGFSGGTLNVDVAHPAHSVPSTFFGVMTEDLNHSGEGGLYPELIQNRSMMASTSSPTSWSAVGDSAIALDGGNPLNTALTRSLKLSINTASSSARAGVANGGFWGIPVRPNQTYTASLFAKASSGFTGPLTVDVESTSGTVYASGTVTGLTTSWQQFTVHLTASASAPTSAANRFVVSATSGAGSTVWLDNVSLFPPTYNNRPNGLRTDLMQKIAGLKPSFIREPGGNYLEGANPANRFNWKKTIGPVWTRPGHQNDAWGYWSTDGLGLLEYLEWAEDVGAQPLLAVYAGYSLWGTHVALSDLGPYVQEALDEIEYATGSTSTTWGARRAADGHPAPFKISYVEVGNEDYSDTSGSYDGDNGRFAQFYDAIKAAYPSMKIISSTKVTARTPDVQDDHFYETADWMNNHSTYYDSASRTATVKTMVGEWGTREGSPTPNLNAAIGDASWLSGLLRNSDVVTQEAYAPLLVNVNNPKWTPDLIGFDALTSYASPAYYVQQMMASAHGDQVLPATYAGTGTVNNVVTKDSSTGRIYVTLVNPSSSAQTVNIKLTGAGTLPSTGTATTLSSAAPTDTNTLSNPNKITPATTSFSGVTSAFARTVPAYSVTILTLG
ncbi:LamG-like jellyroll fold domain-containing protein [Streptomyces sp. NBC_00078]|uniref:LamG-like jellyroll fold domain-containing protein n=1 Tax=unclassified Streptomyces TaxID=2593676 RepID=UPI002257DEF1|nr:LamG-like jellyroll fold domain-containing protein [Streptomyces sp. NBC_00078]MCX5420766.1 alpha-L-arabinofuranosidase [Streptomyces sp. NBC_00078]